MPTHDRSNPESYASPEEIIDDARLSDDEKRDLLNRWHEAVRSRTEAGASGDSPDLLTRLGRALGFLDTSTGRQPVGEDSVLHGPGMAPSVRPSEDENRS